MKGSRITIQMIDSSFYFKYPCNIFNLIKYPSNFIFYFLKYPSNFIFHKNINFNHLFIFVIPLDVYYIITDEHVYIYIAWGLVNHPYVLQVNITSNDFAARQSMPVKKFFEWEYGSNENK